MFDTRPIVFRLVIAALATLAALALGAAGVWLLVRRAWS